MAAFFFGGFRRAAADSHEPAEYSTSWNMRVKRQARNADLADMEHSDHDVTGVVRKKRAFLDTVGGYLIKAGQSLLYTPFYTLGGPPHR